tara:strand:+ start:2416 stop:3318 length:903 start_codon:yes stop_codon:yes gene_type:complete
MEKINKNEKGFTLVLSLVLLLVMSLMGGSLIVISSGDHQSNNTSDEYQQAFYVAETALLQGEKKLIDDYMGPWSNVDDLRVDMPVGYNENSENNKASIEDTKKYESWLMQQSKLKQSKKEVEETNAAGETVTKEVFHARNVDARTTPKNNWEDWETISTECRDSFRNLTKTIDDDGIPQEIKVTHKPIRKSFYKLIEPIFKNDEDIDSTSYLNQDGTAKDKEEIIDREERFLDRFYYEYFSINIGTATYMGTGSSIKKKASDSQSLGTAYKIYGCGIFMNSKKTRTEIIIPLETVMVMPN